VVSNQYDEYYVSGVGLKINFPINVQGAYNCLNWGLAFDVNTVIPPTNLVNGSYYNALEGIGGFQGGLIPPGGWSNATGQQPASGSNWPSIIVPLA
jgi:hypothetical protein